MSFAILYSVLHIAIPFHEIFHIHKESAHKHHGTTEIHEYEKPCCKPVNYFHLNLAILTKQEFVFNSILFSYRNNHYVSYLHQIIANPSNKAPPVEIA